MSNAAKKKAKQRWSIEKAKLDNARKLRGIFFIEPNDEEFKLTLKVARGQGDGVPEACEQQAAADSRGSRTCVCANTFCCERVAHAGSEGRTDVMPWYRSVGVAPPPVRRSRRKYQAARKSDWSPRGAGNRQAPPVLEVHPGNSKAGEDGQNSGEMGGSSPWTRPSAPGCGDTLKALAGDQRPIQGGDRPRRRLQGRYRLGYRPVVLLCTESPRCTVRPT